MTDPALDAILRLAPPPEEPIDGNSEATNVCVLDDIPLPETYVRLAARYGRGSFAEFLNLRSPFASDSCCRPEHSDEGVLWATTSNGDRLFLIQEGAPATWRTAVLASRGGERTSFNASATEFLAGWLEGTLDVPCFPARDEWFDPSFEAAYPTAYRSVFIAFVETPFEERARRLASAIGAHLRAFLPHEEGHSMAQLRAERGTKLQLVDNKGHGARLDIWFRTEDEGAVRARLVAALEALGWPVWRVQRASGEPDWEGVARPEVYRAPPGDPLEEPLRKLIYSLRALARVRGVGAPAAVTEKMLARASEEVHRVLELGWVPEQRPLPGDIVPLFEEILGDGRTA
jgi:hypothetical protein